MTRGGQWAVFFLARRGGKWRDAGDGPYTLLAGMYTWPGLERLPVSDGEVRPEERAIPLTP